MTTISQRIKKYVYDCGYDNAEVACKHNGVILSVDVLVFDTDKEMCNALAQDIENNFANEDTIRAEVRSKYTDMLFTDAFEMLKDKFPVFEPYSSLDDQVVLKSLKTTVREICELYLDGKLKVLGENYARCYFTDFETELAASKSMLIRH